MTGTGGGRIEVSGENNRSVGWLIRQPFHDQAGAFNLYRYIKVKMSIDAYDRAIVFAEHTDCTLSRPATFTGAAGDIRGWT